MRILVTGGAGFIGVNFIHHVLSGNRHSVVVLDDFSMGKLEYLDGYDVEITEGDIQNPQQVAHAMAGVDAVVHLAAHTRVVESTEFPQKNFETNVQGTFNLLQKARENSLKSFIFASTGGAILGEIEPPVHEGMVPHPISPYGASKMAGEAYCYAFSGAYGLPTTCLRFSNIYGPRSYHKGSAVAHFFKQIVRGEPINVYGDGSQTRDFVFVGDLVGTILRCVEQPSMGQCYQLGSGIPTSVNELLHLMQRVVGPAYPVNVTYVEARQGEISHTFADISLARTEIGYSPQMDLEKGLRETWNWIKAAHERQNS